MKIYVVGDSHVYGDELISPEKTSWPILLGQKLGAEVINDGVPCGSNQRNVFNTIKYCANTDIDLFIIAWTSTTKFTFYKSDNNAEGNFNPKLVHYDFGDKDYYKIWGRTLYQTWFNRMYAFRIWMQQILLLQSYLKANNKNYLMVNCHDNALHKWLAPKDQFINKVELLINFDLMNDDQIFEVHDEIQYYNSQIDTDNFYRWNNFAIRDIVSQFPSGPRDHFLEEGHQYIADLIYKHLCLK
jgi:hypothetical protein